MPKGSRIDRRQGLSHSPEQPTQNRKKTRHRQQPEDRSDDQRDTFFRLWTLREARAKATGTGLANSAKAFGFQLDEDNISCRPYNAAGSKDDWQLATLEPLRDHILAVAIHRQGTEHRADQDIHTIQVKT